jgi:16S rRNA (guanine527-N7)-methyltransferase
VSHEARAKDALIHEFNVSRETMERLEAYRLLLIKWSNQINMVGPSTMAHFWERHILDCAQLLPFAGETVSTYADFGSGAGLPGLVIASLLREDRPDHHGYLVESSAKRCGFLREGARILGVGVTLIQQKIELVPPTAVDLVTARAFAPLEKLLTYAYPWSQKGARLIFFKGEDVQGEVAQASTNWSFQSRVKTSVTDSRGCLIEISQLAPRH